MILQTDPKAAYLEHREEIDEAVQRVLGSGWYIHGREVRAFEEEFATYLGVKHAVAVASGTDALELALRACGIGPGDLVATVSHTAVATVAAVELAGATPFLVDVDPRTLTLDVAGLEEMFAGPEGQRIRAVLPVHLYGQAADLPRIRGICRRHGAILIEDCAQAHGALLEGARLGNWGDAAAFSFYPTKNLGALGDGGAVVTSDPQIAETVRLLREYGWRERYVSAIAGKNSRLDEIQAAILRVKLSHLDEDNGRRQRIARAYDAGLAGTALGLPAGSPGHVYHQYVVRGSGRDDLMAHLRRRGVGTLIHYPVPVHLQPAYRDRVPLSARGLAVSESAAREVLSLPLYPQLADGDVQQVIDAVRACSPPAP